MQVYTDVVNRKTTITTFLDTTVYGLISSDSESNDKMVRGKSCNKQRGKLRAKQHSKSSANNRNTERSSVNDTTKSQSNVKLRSRNCDQCKNIVANGMDMYRFYHTGQTVCKNCWITTDPNKGISRRNTCISSTETKLCTVYLKDVLNKELHNGDNLHTIEEDKDNDKLGISDQSSQDEDNSRKMSLRKKKLTANGNAKQGKKRQITSRSDVESIPLKRKKASMIAHKRSLKALSDLDQPSTSFQRKQEHKRKVRHESSSDSDYSPGIKITRRSGRQIYCLTQSLSSTSEEENSNKRQKSVTTEVTKDVHSESNEESSTIFNETGDKGLKRKTKGSISVESTRSRTRSSSISSKEMTPPVEFKSPKTVASQEHACDKCNRTFDTKLAQVKHKLTHERQFTLRLERVNVSNEQKEEESKIDLQEDKTVSEEVNAETEDIASVDKNLTDLSEEIAISIEDTDDEEICPQHKKDDNSDDQKTKSSAEKSESHQKDVSSDILVNKDSNELQQCTNSTTILDEITTDVNDANEDTILIDKVNTSENQDDHTQKDNVTTIKNNKLLDSKKEDTTIEDNTEKTSTVEKEEECTKELDNEIMLDNERTESPVLSIIENNKDNAVEHDKHNESFESNLEDNHKDDENEQINAEARLCADLTTDLKKDPKKSEEKRRCTPDITKMETLDNNEDLMEYPKKQQNVIDEQNAEVKEVADIDKHDDNTDNTIKPNLLHRKKLDQLENEHAVEEDKDVTIVGVVDNDNITAEKSKETTKEIVTTNDSLTEKTTLTEDVNDLEPMIENNAECDLQEKIEENEVCKDLNNISTNTATEIMEEVFDLAAAEVQKRKKNGFGTNLDEDAEIETLENITREIYKSADMPSLDADSAMATDANNIMTSD